jgi:hypothetical protein
MSTITKHVSGAIQTAGGGGALPLTTKGDLVAHDGTTPVRVPVGTAGQIPFASPTATPGIEWGERLPELVDKGDIITHNGSQPVGMHPGTVGQILTVDPAAQNGVSWKNPLSTATRKLVYHLDFKAQPAQNLLADLNPTIDGILWHVARGANAQSIAIVPGTGLVFKTKVGASGQMGPSASFSPVLHTALNIEETGSLANVHPLAQFQTMRTLKVHYLAVFQPLPELTTTQMHGAYFGILKNENQTSIELTDTSGGNAFLTRLGVFEAGAGGAAGLQSGMGQLYRQSQGYYYGRDPGGLPLATNMSHLVQLVTIDSVSFKLASTTMPNAPGPGLDPGWDSFKILQNDFIYAGIPSNRGLIPHLLFAMAQASHPFSTEALIATDLYVYADVM